MKFLVAFLATAFLVGCNCMGSGGKAEPRATSTDAPVEFLVASAVSDFHNHRPPYPSRVRQVRIGHVTAPGGTTRYMLCGDFLPASENGAAEWTSFATIKTDPYEQWLGAQAKGYCEQPSIVWLDGDYSSVLQSRLDSQR